LLHQTLSQLTKSQLSSPLLRSYWLTNPIVFLTYLTKNPQLSAKILGPFGSEDEDIKILRNSSNYFRGQHNAT
jgi:hypothetical protein